MKNYEEIRKEIETLYESGVICMQKSGTDTQYAPIRHALEFIIGEQPRLLQSAVSDMANIPSNRIRFSEAELSDLVDLYRARESTEVKMAVSALEWALGRKTADELYAGEESCGVQQSIRYLGLRWMACYYQYVDARFERAYQAFLDKDEMLQAEVSKQLAKAGFPDARGDQFLEAYALALAESIENIISSISDASRAEIERSIAEVIPKLSAELY